MEQGAEKSTFARRLGAYGIGLTNLPVDVFRYSGLAANTVLEKTGLRDPRTASQVSEWFHSIKNPLDIAGLQQKEPEMFQLGEIVGETFGGLRVAKTLAGLKKAISARGLAAALTQGTATERVIEPTLDKVLT